MEELLRLRLSATSAAFIAAEGISHAKLGSLALNDNTFFRRVVEERQGFTVRIYDRVTKWMSENWPEAAVWPADVPRPRQSRPEDPAAPATPSPKPNSPSSGAADRVEVAA